MELECKHKFNEEFVCIKCALEQIRSPVKYVLFVRREKDLKKKRYGNNKRFRGFMVIPQCNFSCV